MTGVIEISISKLKNLKTVSNFHEQLSCNRSVNCGETGGEGAHLPIEIEHPPIEI